MKKFFIKTKKVLTIFLVATMALVLVACGQQAVEEYVYVPEFMELNEEEHINIYNMQIMGDVLYYISNTYDEETMSYETILYEYSAESNIATPLPIQFAEDRNLNTYTVGADSTVYTVEAEWPSEPDVNGNYEERSFLCQYDVQGNSVMEQEITELLNEGEYNSYVQSIVVDGEGRMYLSCDEMLRLFDAQGNYQGEVGLENGWIQGIGKGKDGKVYMAYYDYSLETTETLLAEVDFAAKQLGVSYTNFPSGNGDGTLIPGITKDFLIHDGSRVYEYDMTSQTYEALFSWVDCDINGSYVEYLYPMKDGRLMVVVNDWDTGETEIACLTKTTASKLPQKTQITIGTLYDDQQLQASAVAFNKQSDTYHINIKTYIDNSNWTENSWKDGIANLNNDIISGNNCPDIIDVSQLNIKQLVSKGVLEDMSPYLEKSQVLAKEDFFESIIESYTYDGKLISIPRNFSLITVVGRTADVGEEMGWTLDELMAYAKENPKASLFDGETKESIMYYMMTYNQDSFIDWTTGECKFDTDEFKKVLEFVNAFPEEYDWEADDRSTPVKIQAGEVLLNMVGIYELNSVQEYQAMYNEPVTYIGYPTSDGSVGCYISAGQLYGITSKSDNKEGAWEFIQYMLTAEGRDMYSWGLPTNKANFEEKVEAATKVEYVLDENGEVYLDENGEPVISGGTSSIGYGDWEYTYHIVTEEEVAIVRELIDVAKPVTLANEEITNIINEEAAAYFKGQKSVDDVAGVIQSRIKIYVDENR